MNPSEDVVSYTLRAETAASRLKAANEVVSDSLLIAMVLKGLPEKFNAFTTIISQQDPNKLDFQQFKKSLRSYDENERSREAHWR